MKAIYKVPDGALRYERRRGGLPVDLQRLALITFIKRMLFFVVFIAGMWLFSGCAAKPEPVCIYQDVYVPVKCGITAPAKPVFPSPAPGGGAEARGAAALSVAGLIEYAESLRSALAACTE